MNDTRPDTKVAQRGAQTPKRTLDERINDANSDLVRDALTRTCDGCKAGIGVLCHNHLLPGHEPLPGRLVHLARLIDRRNKR